MNRITIQAIFTLLLINATFANPVPTAPTQTQPNIKILSEQMDCDQSHNVCVAKGNAIAEKLDDSKVKILKADQITSYFSKEGGTGPLKVTRLEAEGNVFFIIGDIIVQGKRGTYLAENDVAEVFDDVKITNEKNQLDGGYAKVNMKTGHYSIKRGSEPVQALIFTKDSKQEAKKDEQKEE
jgi:lipopolysaccharide export system protein LptA